MVIFQWASENDKSTGVNTTGLGSNLQVQAGQQVVGVTAVCGDDLQ